MSVFLFCVCVTIVSPHVTRFDLMQLLICDPRLLLIAVSPAEMWE